MCPYCSKGPLPRRPFFKGLTHGLVTCWNGPLARQPALSLILGLAYMALLRAGIG